MEPKTFSVTRADRPGIHVTGFPPVRNRAFINLKVGNGFDGEFQMALYTTDAIALALAISDAIFHADPAAAEAAALGRLEEVAP